CGRGAPARSAGGVRGRAQRIDDHHQHALEIRMHVIVPKPQYAKLVVGKPPIATPILGRLGMLTAIYLDHQARLVTEEVGDIRPDRNLAPELRAGQSAAAQSVPNFAFGIGQPGAKNAGATRGCRKGPLTRLAPSALGTLSRKGRGFRSPRPAHRFTSHVVVPSGWSVSATPMLTSSSRMRSASEKFLTLRAALRACFSLSTVSVNARTRP